MIKTNGGNPECGAFPNTLFDANEFSTVSSFLRVNDGRFDDYIPNAEEWKEMRYSLSDLHRARRDVGSAVEISLLNEQILPLFRAVEQVEDLAELPPADLYKDAHHIISLTTVASRTPRLSKETKSQLYLQATGFFDWLKRNEALTHPERLVGPAAEIATIHRYPFDISVGYKFADIFLESRTRDASLLIPTATNQLYGALINLSEVDGSDKPIQRLYDAFSADYARLLQETSPDRPLPDDLPEITLIELLRETHIIRRRSRLTERILRYAQERGVVIDESSRVLLLVGHGDRGADAYHQSLEEAIRNGGCAGTLFDLSLQPVEV